MSEIIAFVFWYHFLVSIEPPDSSGIFTLLFFHYFSFAQLSLNPTLTLPFIKGREKNLAKITRVPTVAAAPAAAAF
jgi:hypothetical protein